MPITTRSGWNGMITNQSGSKSIGFESQYGRNAMNSKNGVNCGNGRYLISPAYKSNHFRGHGTR